LAYSGPAIFTAANWLNSFRLFVSQDQGQSWQELEAFLGPVLYKLAANAENCFAARSDGLWHTPVSFLPVEPGNEDVFPDKIELRQNYPNPFNPLTNLRFEISDFGFVELEIFNVNGQKIATLVSKELPPGEYEVQWDARDDAGREVGGGVYFYRLTVNGYSLAGKALYLK